MNPEESLNRVPLEATLAADGEKLFTACVKNFMHIAASGCYSDHYGYLAFSKIPLNGNLTEIVTWLDKFLAQTLGVYGDYAKLKRNAFGKSSEKSGSTEDVINSIDKKLKNSAGRLTENEYNAALQQINQKIAEVTEIHKKYADGGANYINQCEKAIVQLKELMKEQKELMKRGFIPNSETSYSNTKRENQKTGEVIDVNGSDISNDASEDIPLDEVENEDKVKEIIEKGKKDKKEYLKDKKREKEEFNQFINDITKDKPEGDTVVPVIPEVQYNPITGEEVCAYISAVEERSNKLIDCTFRQYQEAHNSIIALRTKDNDYFEYNPAAVPDVILYKGNELSSHLNEYKILPHDTEDQIALKMESSVCQYSKAFYDVTYITDNNILVYSPLEHLGAVGWILAKRAVFVKFSMTENTAITMYVNFLVFMTSKSLIAEWFELNTGHHYSRQYIIKFVISFTRVFKGLVDEMKRYAISHAKTLHFDETQYRCIKISGKCYIWVAVTGKHEIHPVSIFMASEGRKHTDFLKFFGINANEDGSYTLENNLESTLKNIVSDGYSAYPTGIKILKKYILTICLHGMCIVHVRRDFLNALEAFGILKEYLRAVKLSRDKKFKKCLYEELVKSNKNKKLLPIVYKIAYATFLLDLIIGLDIDFICKDSDEILKRRQNHSKKLLDEFFRIVREIYEEKIKYIKKNKHKDGSFSYCSNGISIPFIKAIIYALNHEKTMYAFLEDGDIETHNNIAETVIRRIVRQRDNMLFLYSKYDYVAYDDSMTLFATITNLDINPYYYFQWALDNAKIQLYEKWCTTTRPRKYVCELFSFWYNILLSGLTALISVEVAQDTLLGRASSACRSEGKGKEELGVYFAKSSTTA